MIVPSFTTFRFQFASVLEVGGPMTFTAPDQVINANAAAYPAGMRINPAGTASNNAYYTILSNVAGTITTVEQGVVTEPNAPGSTLSGALVDNDGLESWPVDLVRGLGFDGGIVRTVEGSSPSLFTLSVNGGVDDSVPLVDEYDWYLSQRTEILSKQYLIISQALNKSGSVNLVATTLAQETFLLAPLTDLTAEQTALLLKFAHLYVKRRSDGAIQWIDLLELQTSQL